MNVLFAIFILCIASTFGFVEFDHPCRETVRPKENFSTLFYNGVWFEILHSLNGDDDDLVQCVDHRYTRRPGQHIFSVERFGVFRETFITENSVVSAAHPDETPLRGLFNGTIERVNGGNINYFYRIHATDYTNYAIAWSCTELRNNRSREEISVLSRGTSLTAAVFEKVGALLQEIGYQDHVFRYIVHSPDTCGL